MKRKKSIWKRWRWRATLAAIAGVVIALVALECQVWGVADTLARFIHAVVESGR